MTLGKRLYWIVGLVAVLALAAAAVAATSQFTSAGGSNGAATREAEDADCDDGSGGSAAIPQPTLRGKLKKLPVAPDSARVDLNFPTFSNPTEITNPLFPISDLHSAVLLGSVDGLPFRAETTLLPDTKTICWDGQEFEALVSMYTAYSNGRIEEVALDFYAQADDGAVWYLGEDVFNYEDGVVADTDGTWLAGRDGPAAMIMPANPQVGDTYRPENAPPLVFEEVTVKQIGVTVEGPSGSVAGAIITTELHMDGTTEEKTFAPGYGEFFTGSGGDSEAMALAVTTDALAGPPHPKLTELTNGATAILDAAEAGDWDAAAATLDDMTVGWATYQNGHQVPPLIEAEMNDALDALSGAVAAQNGTDAGTAALDVALASLDLQLRHRPVAEIDLARFGLWTQQILVDAAADDAAGVTGDVAVLEWVQDRFAHTLNPADAAAIDAHLVALRAAADAEDLEAAAAAADAEDLEAAAAAAEQLLETLADL